MRLGKAIRDQRPVGEAERDERGARRIEPKGAREGAAFFLFAHARELAGIGKAHAQREDGDHRQRRGDAEPEKCVRVLSVMGEHQRRDQRPGQRACLVQRLVQAECPTLADLLAGSGHHEIGGGIANRLAGTLEDDQRGCRPPHTGERHRRHRRHLHHVACERERPIGAGTVGEPSRCQPQHIAEQLAGASDDSHRRAAGAEQREIGSRDAAHAFIRRVGKQAHDAEGDDEGKAGSPVEIPRAHAGDCNRVPPLPAGWARTICSRGDAEARREPAP